MSKEKTETSTTTSEKSQRNPFEDLHVPTEVVLHIQRYLEKEEDLSAFARTCRLFGSDQDARLVLKLLECVAAGNQDRAQRLLIIRPELAAFRGRFTDWSGRTFYCSPFEYATWALDVRYMCPMMLDGLPISERGEELRINLLEQFKTLQEKGLSYTLNGETHTETHFSFAVLKEALQTYITQFDNWTGPQREDQWCKGVGKAQLPLPAHVRQHYCGQEKSSHPNPPTFDKKCFKRSLEFVNWVKMGIIELWDDSLTGLGVDFGIGRGTVGGGSERYGQVWIAPFQA